MLHPRYLAQNAAIWLADEVLRYHDHDTSRCQDDISWHLITQQSKGRNVNNGSCIVAKKRRVYSYLLWTLSVLIL